MPVIKKISGGATIKAWLCFLIFVSGAVFGTKTVQAYEFQEDFDAYTNGSSLSSPWGGGGGYTISNLRSISSPNSLRRAGNGTQLYSLSNLGSSTQGIIQQQINIDAISNFGGHYIELLEGGNDAGIGMRLLDFGSDSSHRVQCGTFGSVNGEVNISETPWVLDVWFTITLEYRQVQTGMEFRCAHQFQNASTVYSEWYLQPGTSVVTGAQFTTSHVSAGDISYMDNFYIATDLDAVPVLEQTNDSAFTENFNTRFINLTTGSDSLTVSYYLDQDEINTSISSLNPSLIRFRYSERPSLDVDTLSYSIPVGLQGTSSLLASVSSLSNGTYDVYIDYSNSSVLFGSPEPFDNAYISAVMTISGTTVTLSQLEFFDGTQIQQDDVAQDCGVFDLSGCIVNAFRYLFIPSDTAVNSFGTTFASLQTKAPFVYLYQVQSSVVTIWQNPSQLPTISIPFGSFGDITLMSASLLSSVPFMSTIRVILGALIWVMLSMTIYRRVLKIFDTQTTV